MHLVGIILFTLVVPAANAQLSLDELYTSPQLIGTAPKRPVWSADSENIAFLWNDAGGDVYDLWITNGSRRRSRAL